LDTAAAGMGRFLAPETINNRTAAAAAQRDRRR